MKRTKSLKNKKILLGITGSVAAYKAVELIRRLKDMEASVRVIMTDASCRFITPLSVELAAGEKPFLGMFDDPLAHINLSAEADLMLIAPATANTIGKMAQGLADDLLSASCMAFRGPLVIAPAMNPRMYQSPALRRNLDWLLGHGALEVPPAEGMLACGEEGKGRMAEVEDIIEYCHIALAPRDMEGRKVIVTAGPTRESMDPVRFISNRSSGRMGYSMARAAKRRGADVILISGPSALRPPIGVELVRVESAAEMHKAVMENLQGAEMLVMAAAVADFAPRAMSDEKLSKGEISDIRLSPCPDILKDACNSPQRPAIVVGFAAQTGQSTDKAAGKLRDKGADYIVFNDVTEPDAGFDVETNKVTLIGREGSQPLPLMSKDETASALMSLIIQS